MNTPLYVGICGRMGAGKDTVAELIKGRCENFGFVVIVARFAEPIKRAAWLFFDVNKDVLQDTELKNNTMISFSTADASMSVRELLQGVGSSMRTIHTNFWVELFHRQYGPTVWGCGGGWEEEKGRVILVPDLRYANEEEYIKQQGGLIVKVARPSDGPLAGAIHQHASEVSYKDIEEDYMIMNDQTIEDLAPQIDSFFRLIIRRL